MSTPPRTTPHNRNYSTTLKLSLSIGTWGRGRNRGHGPHEHQRVSPTALELTRADPARAPEAEEGTALRLPQAGTQPRAGRAKGRATAAPSPGPAGGLRQRGPPSPLDPHPPQPPPVSAGRGPRPVPAHGSPGRHRPGLTAGSRRSLPPAAAPLSAAPGRSRYLLPPRLFTAPQRRVRPPHLVGFVHGSSWAGRRL